MPQGRPSISAHVKRQIYIESGHRCAVCGTAFPMERAHIIPWRETHDHSASNLICMCANCHEMADGDNWSEATLREYKETPWVHRNFGKASFQPAPKQPVEIKIRMQKTDFGEYQIKWLQFALAGFLNIHPDCVEIESVMEGSVIALVRLPKAAADRLLSRSADDAELRAYLAPLEVMGIRSLSTSSKVDSPPADDSSRELTASTIQTLMDFPGRMNSLHVRLRRLLDGEALINKFFSGKDSDALRHLEHALLSLTTEAITRAIFLSYQLYILNHSINVEDPVGFEAYLESLVEDLNQFSDDLICLRADRNSCPLRQLRSELNSRIREGGLNRDLGGKLNE